MTQTYINLCPLNHDLIGMMLMSRLLYLLFAACYILMTPQMMNYRLITHQLMTPRLVLYQVMTPIIITYQLLYRTLSSNDSDHHNLNFKFFKSKSFYNFKELVKILEDYYQNLSSEINLCRSQLNCNVPNTGMWNLSVKLSFTTFYAFTNIYITSDLPKSSITTNNHEFNFNHYWQLSLSVETPLLHKI